MLHVDLAGNGSGRPQVRLGPLLLFNLLVWFVVLLSSVWVWQASASMAMTVLAAMAVFFGLPALAACVCRLWR